MCPSLYNVAAFTDVVIINTSSTFRKIHKIYANTWIPIGTKEHMHITSIFFPTKTKIRISYGGKEGGEWGGGDGPNFTGFSNSYYRLINDNYDPDTKYMYLQLWFP